MPRMLYFPVGAGSTSSTAGTEDAGGGDAAVGVAGDAGAIGGGGGASMTHQVIDAVMVTAPG